MNDYISREGILAEYDRQHKGPPGGARKIMETYPRADVRPVVMCSECRWHSKPGNRDFCYALCRACPNNADFFCALGERRREEQEGNHG